MSNLTRPWPLPSGFSSWLIAAAVAVALLAAVAFVDAQVSLFGQGIPEALVAAFEWITRLGESDWILIPTLAVFAIAGLASLLSRAQLKPALREVAGVSGFIFVGVGLPSLFTTIVKRLIGRARPELLEADGPFHFGTSNIDQWLYQSFPSGHATTAFSLCFVIAFLVPRSFPWMLGFAVLVALSRIVLGAHYPTDVIGGAIVGTLGAYLVRNVFAQRGWVFAGSDDGRIVRKPLIGLAKLLGRG